MRKGTLGLTASKTQRMGRKREVEGWTIRSIFQHIGLKRNNDHEATTFIGYSQVLHFHKVGGLARDIKKKRFVKIEAEDILSFMSLVSKNTAACTSFDGFFFVSLPDKHHVFRCLHPLVCSASKSICSCRAKAKIPGVT